MRQMSTERARKGNERPFRLYLFSGSETPRRYLVLELNSQLTITRNDFDCRRVKQKRDNSSDGLMDLGHALLFVGRPLRQKIENIFLRKYSDSIFGQKWLLINLEFDEKRRVIRRFEKPSSTRFECFASLCQKIFRRNRSIQKNKWIKLSLLG